MIGRHKLKVHIPLFDKTCPLSVAGVIVVSLYIFLFVRIIQNSNNTWCTASRFLRFFCFFVPLKDFFYTYGEDTITSEGLQTLTYTPNSWQFNIPGNPSALFNLVSHKIHLVNSNFTLSKVPNSIPKEKHILMIIGYLLLLKSHCADWYNVK